MIDELRQVLQTKAVAAAGYASVPIKLADEPFVPPTDGSIWAHFWFQMGNITPSVGGRTAFQKQNILVQFTLYGPEGDLDGNLTRKGDELKALFELQQWPVSTFGYVNTDPFAVKVMSTNVQGHRICVVDGAAYYYFRNANPDNRLS